MTFALRLPSLRLPSRRRRPKTERRPRLKLDPRARAALSRDARWKRRGSSGGIGKVIAGLAVVGVAAALWIVYKPAPAPAPVPSPFPDFVVQAEAAFPEALRGYTRARAGQLADGRAVPVALSLLLPAHTLESAAAAPDALTRLSAPFVGAQRAIPGEEMGARIAALAAAALPADVSRCYTYATGVPRRVVLADARKVRAVAVDIVFNPECEGIPAPQ